MDHLSRLSNRSRQSAALVGRTVNGHVARYKVARDVFWQGGETLLIRLATWNAKKVNEQLDREERSL